MEIPLHGHHLLNPNYLQQIINPPPPPPEPSDRLPQWTHDETREFLAIRAQLDRSFSQSKRNKPLWEAVSSSLHQRGVFRSPDQCKSKWKNLVTRFKGSETSGGEPSRQQFPFYEQMKSIFAERGKAAVQMDRPEEEVEEEERGSSRKRRRTKRGGGEEELEVESTLREFMRRQREMEARWVEAAEAREAERRATEEEWRAAMEGLQAERAQMERRWREREEERRAREEARAERRHAVVMALLDKIAQDL